MAEEGFDMVISPEGNVAFDVVGGKGRGCLQMANELVAALGDSTVTNKPDMYKQQTPAQRLQQKRGGGSGD